MGVSARRREQRAKRAAKKEARMKSPGIDSRYARKVRGDNPPNSPHEIRAHLGIPAETVRRMGAPR